MLIKRNYKFVFVVVVFLFLMASGIASVILAQDDTWTTIDGMPRSCCTASEIDGVIYVIGGYNVNPGLHSIGTNIVESYDLATSNWTTKSSMLTTRMLHCSCTVNGKIYAIGGYQRSHYDPPIDIVEEYDPLTDTWTTKRPMPTKRSCFAVGVVDGKIYAIGGLANNYAELSKVEMYDPIKDSWTTKAPMPKARNYLSASVVDGKIYVIGGSVGVFGVLNTVEMYDPATNTWKKKTGMPTPRVCLSTSAINGKIYAIGGAKNNFPDYDPLKTLEEYDPETDTWTSRANMPTPRVFLTSSAVNGKIYVFGGSSIGNPFNVVSSVDVYTVPTTSVENTSTKLPIEFALYQNYPNPFNPSTMIIFSIPEPNFSTIKVYDLLGKEIQTLVSQFFYAGTYSVNFDARNLTSGAYFYKLKSGDLVEIRKMLLIR